MSSRGQSETWTFPDAEKLKESGPRQQHNGDTAIDGRTRQQVTLGRACPVGLCACNTLGPAHRHPCRDRKQVHHGARRQGWKGHGASLGDGGHAHHFQYGDGFTGVSLWADTVQTARRTQRSFWCPTSPQESCFERTWDGACRPVARGQETPPLSKQTNEPPVLRWMSCCPLCR